MEKITITSRKTGFGVETFYEGSAKIEDVDYIDIKKAHENILSSSNMSKLTTIIEGEK